MHTARRLLERGDKVVGIDDVNDYYDVRLKYARLEQLKPFEKFRFIKMDIADREAMQKLFVEHEFPKVIHLAAQAGVRYSLKNPHAYIQSNVVGFLNVLEGCRHHKIEHLVYASSSSVYGSNTKIPFSEHDNVDHPISLYAATKRSNELMAHTYSHLYRLPTTGLRFFTVYGPWGRPDMAPMIFARAIMEGTPIDVFNHGDMKRDFTYIDDIVTGVVATLDNVAAPNNQFDSANPDPASSRAPFHIYNIGNHQPVELMAFIHCLERVMGKKAKLNLLPIQLGDVVATYADVAGLKQAVGFAPSTPLDTGVGRFLDWYLDNYTGRL